MNLWSCLQQRTEQSVRFLGVPDRRIGIEATCLPQGNYDCLAKCRSFYRPLDISDLPRKGGIEALVSAPLGSDQRTAGYERFHRLNLDAGRRTYRIEHGRDLL